MSVVLKYSEQYWDPLLFSNSLWCSLTCTLVLLFKYMYTGPTALCDLRTMEQLELSALLRGTRSIAEILAPRWLEPTLGSHSWIHSLICSIHCTTLLSAVNKFNFLYETHVCSKNHPQDNQSTLVFILFERYDQRWQFNVISCFLSPIFDQICIISFKVSFSSNLRILLTGIFAVDSHLISAGKINLKINHYRYSHSRKIIMPAIGVCWNFSVVHRFFKPSSAINHSLVQIQQCVISPTELSLGSGLGLELGLGLEKG